MAQKKTFVLRLSPEMYADIEKWSAQEFRSVNGQIEFVLSRAISDWKGGKARKSEKPFPETPNEHG